MRDRVAWLGGLQVSGAGHLPASVAVWKDGFRSPWQARRAPPEALLIGKRCDPPLPLTGNNRKRSGCPAIRKRNRPAITWTAGRRVSGCVDQASRQNSSWKVLGTNGKVPSRSSWSCFAMSASAFGLPKPLAHNASTAPMLS